MSTIAPDELNGTAGATENQQAIPMTEEEIAALESQRKAEYEAKLAPYAAFKAQMDATITELTDLQMALIDFYEQMLNP